MTDMNWVSAPFTKLIEQYNQLDAKMQRRIRWLVVALIFVLFGVVALLFSIAYKNTLEPESVTEYKTKIEYRDTCIDNAQKIDKSVHQTGDYGKQDIEIN